MRTRLKFQRKGGNKKVIKSMTNGDLARLSYLATRLFYKDLHEFCTNLPESSNSFLILPRLLPIPVQFQLLQTYFRL